MGESEQSQRPRWRLREGPDALHDGGAEQDAGGLENHSRSESNTQCLRDKLGAGDGGVREVSLSGICSGDSRRKSHIGVNPNLRVRGTAKLRACAESSERIGPNIFDCFEHGSARPVLR